MTWKSTLWIVTRCVRTRRIKPLVALISVLLCLVDGLLQARVGQDKLEAAVDAYLQSYVHSQNFAAVV
jgi:hypothetical protein